MTFSSIRKVRRKRNKECGGYTDLTVRVVSLSLGLMAFFRYLIYVFDKEGRNIKDYPTDHLEQLAIISAVHKGCKLEVFDFQTFSRMSAESVRCEVENARKGLRRDISTPKKEINIKVEAEKKRRRQKKFWTRPVKCVETGQVFSSIRACSAHFNLPHKAVWNALRSGSERNGYHFVFCTKL